MNLLNLKVKCLQQVIELERTIEMMSSRDGTGNWLLETIQVMLYDLLMSPP